MDVSDQHPAIEILESYKKLIWPEIQNYLVPQTYPQTFNLPDKYTKDIENAYWQPLKEYPERQGKYLRGSIILLVAESMGMETKSAIKTAAAMQLSEDWLLIHDDWEDKSLLRRGKPALHREFTPEIAVNAGDALHILMWKILLDNEKLLGSEKTMEIANEFYTMLSRTALGQAVEIDWMQKNTDRTEDNDWYFIADGKTSYYTMAGPARLGGLIGNANQNQLEKLSQFGLMLGRCFQLVDDLLDVTSDFNGLKEYANDIYEGKRTLILGHLTRTMKVNEKEKLKSILKKSREEKTKEEVDWVLTKMKEYGSIEYGWNIAGELKEKALKVFNEELDFLRDAKAREKLKLLINFVLERNH